MTSDDKAIIEAAKVAVHFAGVYTSGHPAIRDLVALAERLAADNAMLYRVNLRLDESTAASFTALGARLRELADGRATGGRPGAVVVVGKAIAKALRGEP